jgi:hypothetical protein
VQLCIFPIGLQEMSKLGLGRSVVAGMRHLRCLCEFQGARARIVLADRLLRCQKLKNRRIGPGRHELGAKRSVEPEGRAALSEQTLNPRS